MRHGRAEIVDGFGAFSLSGAALCILIESVPAQSTGKQSRQRGTVKKMKAKDMVRDLVNGAPRRPVPDETRIGTRH